MPDFINQILNLTTIVFCVSIFVLVWLQRRVVELIFPKILTKKYWRELLIPVGPVATGGIIGATISSYPYPDIFKSSWPGRAAFGIFCGLFSGLVYRLIKKNIAEKLGISVPMISKSSADDTTDQIE